MVQDPEQLVDCVGPEGVSHLWPIKGNPHRALVHGPVVGQVGQVEARYYFPSIGVEDR
jgi:hypothetical protein